jgi:hypothetical protein
VRAPALPSGEVIYANEDAREQLPAWFVQVALDVRNG